MHFLLGLPYPIGDCREFDVSCVLLPATTLLGRIVVDE
jgi:hypothetical protein